MGWFQSEKPKDLNYGQIISDTLRTQAGLQPLLLSAENQYQPAQTALTLRNMDQLLFGTPEQSWDVQTYRPSVFLQGNKLSYGKVPKEFLGEVERPGLPSWQKGRWVYPNGSAAGPGAGGGSWSTGGGAGSSGFGGGGAGPVNGELRLQAPTEGMPGAMGLLQNPTQALDLLKDPGKALEEFKGPQSVMDAIFGSDDPRVRVGQARYGTERRGVGAQRGLVELMNEVNTANRGAQVADISMLGPEAIRALLESNPEAAGILNRLNAQATAGLDAGTALTPEEERIMAQQARAAWAARGLGGSAPAAADEVLRQYALGQQLQRQRQAFAQSVLNQNQSYLQNPMLALLSANGGAGASGQAQSLLPTSQFNPESPFAGNIAAANQQLAALFAEPSTMQKINQTTQTVGNILGAVGKIGGGVAGFM